MCEGQVFWARYKSRGVAGFAICYILRMYSPPGGDQHDVLVDIIWGGNGGLMAGMEYQDTNKPRFELKNEPDVWTLFDGWFDTISADALSPPAPYKLVYSTTTRARRPQSFPNYLTTTSCIWPVWGSSRSARTS